MFEHGNRRPDNFVEDWEGQFDIIPWMAYLSSIPHVIFMVTTMKENGLPNAALHGWASFTGEGDNYYIIMPVMKHTHTYENIKRDKVLCVNFLSAEHVLKCKQSIKNNCIDIDEIKNAGFTPVMSKAINVPSIEESFLKLECELEWEKELYPNSLNITICIKVKHISANEHFVRLPVRERYGEESFMFHLMAMKNPYTGERIKGGIGRIEVIKEMEL